MTESTYAPDVEAQLRTDAAAILARYPDPRSGLLPLLHLVQSVDGYVAPRGIALCAELLGLTRAEVSAVATFYSQYKRHPSGEYLVGVCTNALCAVMGGDVIWDALAERLGIGHDETTPDGKITLEQLECNAACDYAPVVMVNWEFFDNQTPTSALEIVDRIEAGQPVHPTRGAETVASFKEVSRVLAGFEDGRADEGVAAGAATLVGLRVAREHDWRAPEPAGQRAAAPQAQTAGTGPVGESQSSAERKPTTPGDTDPKTVDPDVKGEAK